VEGGSRKGEPSLQERDGDVAEVRDVREARRVDGGLAAPQPNPRYEAVLFDEVRHRNQEEGRESVDSLQKNGISP
jgi:hypothetical protein